MTMTLHYAQGSSREAQSQSQTQTQTAPALEIAAAAFPPRREIVATDQAWPKPPCSEVSFQEMGKLCVPARTGTQAIHAQ